MSRFLNTYKVSLMALKSSDHMKIWKYVTKRIKDKEDFELVCEIVDIDKNDESNVFFNKLLRAAAKVGIILKC